MAVVDGCVCVAPIVVKLIEKKVHREPPEYRLLLSTAKSMKREVTELADRQ